MFWIQIAQIQEELIDSKTPFPSFWDLNVSFQIYFCCRGFTTLCFFLHLFSFLDSGSFGLHSCDAFAFCFKLAVQCGKVFCLDSRQVQRNPRSKIGHKKHHLPTDMVWNCMSYNSKISSQAPKQNNGTRLVWLLTQWWNWRSWSLLMARGARQILDGDPFFWQNRVNF